CRGICGENCVWIVLRGPTLYSAAFPGRLFRDPRIHCCRWPIAGAWRMAVLPPAPQRTVALTTGLHQRETSVGSPSYSTAWTSPTSNGPCSNRPSARAVARMGAAGRGPSRGRPWRRDRSAGRHERRPLGPAHGRAVARPAIALSAVPDLPSSLPTLAALGPPRSAAATPRRGPPGPRQDRSE